MFDTLTLKPLTGSFSLMGGADGPVADPDYPMPAYFGADAGRFDLRAGRRCRRLQ